MSTFSNLEELDVWKAAMHLSHQVHTISWSDISQTNPSLIQEFRTVSLSIPREIARGFLKTNPQEFIIHLKLANEACTEMNILSSMLHGLDFMEGGINHKLQSHLVQLRQKIDLLLRYLVDQSESAIS